MSAPKLAETTPIRLLQVLRRQVSRYVPSGRRTPEYSVLHGNPLRVAEVNYMERQGYIRWAPPLDDLVRDEVAHLTPAGEKALADAKGTMPDRSHDPADQLLSMLGLIAMRKEGYAAQKEEALRERRWSLIAGLDGIVTGLLISEAILKDELKSLAAAKVVALRAA